MPTPAELYAAAVAAFETAALALTTLIADIKTAASTGDYSQVITLKGTREALIHDKAVKEAAMFSAQGTADLAESATVAATITAKETALASAEAALAAAKADHAAKLSAVQAAYSDSQRLMYRGDRANEKAAELEAAETARLIRIATEQIN